ncbi:MFS transporter [Dulcicalothrix desertica PCC 7102]|uniref:MFS transporter n=1 Tax=Dulcicalothrix desertica PCC 7102 TaxID=232991 RepID=A0A3S1ATN8_9CYAN|nr:MFS transporter [Dulcicalothrix desertica]RUT09013.1 MFS transporter [Dulcicalothrix desertica PCC 7102]TWH49897.1 Na+/melibiose symporter-like transporter [Dulcicalothrix desertica PCC 7102]
MNSIQLEIPALDTITDAPASSVIDLEVTTDQNLTNQITNKNLKIPKDKIRTSLRASTVDSVFATIFSITTTGILLSNFLVQLGADAVAFGMLSSIPMLVNLIQPLGAYLSEQTTSRFRYSMWIYGTSRCLWAVLAVGVFMAYGGLIDSHQLINLTLLIVLATNLLGGFGGASWLSWLAMIVPRRLRGRYFGIRNSVSSLTNLICVPIAGVIVSTWSGGTLQGYGVVLSIGILFGFISLACQCFKVDINPQEQNSIVSACVSASQQEPISTVTNTAPPQFSVLSIFKDSNFLTFILYFGLWMFAVNLSMPFFNLYMLDTLALDVSWVTFYGSIQAGANLFLMVLWGRLADRFGNRPILALVGILVAITPLLWLGVGTHNIDLWLWLPLLHILTGGTWAAIDLCNNNLQIGVAPIRNQSSYFAIAAAVAGACGALGTTIGGFIVQNNIFGGLPGLFALSCIFRLVALIPVVFVNEPRRKSLFEFIQEIRQYFLQGALQK